MVKELSARATAVRGLIPLRKGLTNDLTSLSKHRESSGKLAAPLQALCRNQQIDLAQPIMMSSYCGRLQRVCRVNFHTVIRVRNGLRKDRKALLKDVRTLLSQNNGHNPL
jgi:hypothetical protein